LTLLNTTLSASGAASRLGQPAAISARLRRKAQAKTAREMGPLRRTLSCAAATTRSHTRGTPTRMAGRSALMSAGSFSMLPCTAWWQHWRAAAGQQAGAAPVSISGSEQGRGPMMTEELLLPACQNPTRAPSAAAVSTMTRS
jgi:hypothetical protein